MDRLGYGLRLVTNIHRLEDLPFLIYFGDAFKVNLTIFLPNNLLI